MNVIIFGATGGTGQQLISQALQKGHAVTAFARKPTQDSQNGVTWVTGDVLDLPSVEQAIKGQDAVLCALGAPAMNKKEVRTQGTKNIISAMEKGSVKRLICQSALGCQESYQLLPFSYKYLIIPLMLRHVYADHNLQEEEIKKSALNWSIVRPSALVDTCKDEKMWHGTTQPNIPNLSMKVSRKDVANFMLDQLETNAYLNQAVNVSYSS